MERHGLVCDALLHNEMRETDTTDRQAGRKAGRQHKLVTEHHGLVCDALLSDEMRETDRQVGRQAGRQAEPEKDMNSCI